MARSPLFDTFDPNGDLEELARLGLLDDEELLLQGPFAPRKPQISDLMPEEEKSGLLNALSKGASSGLSWAGYLLDTPGALLRGTLAGDPLSVFGNSEERVSGRDLLRQYGVVGDEDTWGNFGGGMVAEALLDPLTYMTGGLSMFGRGSLSQAGKAAAAAGLLRNEALDSVTRVGRLRQAQNLPAYTDAIPTPRVREARRLATPTSLLDDLADPAMQPWTQQAAAGRQAAEARLRQQMERFGATDMDASLGVLDNVRIPGTNIGFEIDGGAFGDSIARGFDRFGDFTKRAPIIGNATRAAAALISKDAGGIPTLSRDLELTNEAQLRSRMARAAARTSKEDLLRDYTRLQFDARNANVPDVIPAGFLAAPGPQAIPKNLRSYNQPLYDSLMDYVEAPVLPGPTLSGAQGYKSSGDAVADWVMENVPEFRAIRDRFDELGPNANQAAQAAGLKRQFAASRGVGGFMPRQLRFFQNPSPPDIPGGMPYTGRNFGRDDRAFSVQDNFGRKRDPAYDLAGGVRAFRYLTGNVDPTVVDSTALQRSLIGADQPRTRQLIDDALASMGKKDSVAFTRGGTSNPFDFVLPELYASRKFQQAGRPLPAGQFGPAPLTRKQRRLITNAEADVTGRYDRLGNLLRTADTQFAEQGVGIFDTPSWNNALRYEEGQATNIANAGQLLEFMRGRAQDVPASTVAGQINIPLQEAAKQLGFDPRNFRQLWQQQVGGDVTNYSIPRRAVEAMKTLVPESRLAEPERGILGAVDQFTSMFKIGALASPAYHVRNAYSGAMNSAYQGAFNPMDALAAWRAGQGNTGPLGRRLVKDRTSPYFGMNPEDAAREFLIETGAQRVSVGNVLTDASGIDDPASVRGLYTGASTEPTVGQAAKELLMGKKGRSRGEFLNDFFRMRGVGFNPRSQNTNPLLVLNDSVGQSVEDALRTGTFLNQVRKGVDPGVAGDLTRLTQLDYSPESFTGFERNVMKRLMPFYSFQRRILPSIADNMINRPGGLQGQTIRAITRASEPNEDNFIPEHLRQTAAIPLPEGFPTILGGSPGDGLQRYLTNIDLPFESTLNMFTPGVGSTLPSMLASTIAKTGSNILGQTTPLLKAPLEYVTNRQLYSGRDMSDLYSVLEQDLGPIGRPLEQAVANFVPFGSRALGVYRQLNDDRLSPTDARMKTAFNLLAGLKLTDVDEDRTKRLAAREMLNQLLETTPGVKTYENLTVPEDALATMPEEQRRLYLLYRVLQSEAAKRARERKKTALDPLAVLSAVQ